jgi:TolB-like protein/thioredoxin-like negative regulator of GroEL
MSESSKAVFLSYASQDTEPAKRICDALKQAGVEVWFDQSELRGGDAWDAKIRKQIKECALFVPVISRQTQERLEGYFRLEWRLAEQRTHLMARGKPFLFPVVTDGTRDADARVPESFNEVQWTRLTGDAAQVRAFADRIKEVLVSSGNEPGRESGAPAIQAPSAGGAVEHSSVAVLAFANLSNDPENEYFSDGISEELLNVLAKVSGLKVSARTSAFSFKGRSVPIPEIARILGVAYVVEGSVRKAGDRVRITAQLIKAADGFHVWSDTFTRELKDIFAVQDEIAAVIATNLKLKLNVVARPVTVDPAAYELYLAGRQAWNLRTTEGYIRAEQLLGRALALAPDFGRAHAALADVWLLRDSESQAIGRLGQRGDREFVQIEDSIKQALAFEPSSADAHASLGLARTVAWRTDEAEREFRLAIELSANCAKAHHWLGMGLLLVGRVEEAVAELSQATELDPLAARVVDNLALALFMAGRTDEALNAAERALAVQPGALQPLTWKSWSLLRLHRTEEALVIIREMRARGAPAIFWLRGLVRAGLVGEAEQSASGLGENDPGRLFLLLQQDRRDDAVALLVRTMYLRPFYLFLYLPEFDPIREDPRLVGLLADGGMTEAHVRAQAWRAAHPLEKSEAKK